MLFSFVRQTYEGVCCCWVLGGGGRCFGCFLRVILANNGNDEGHSFFFTQEVMPRQLVLSFYVVALMKKKDLFLYNLSLSELYIQQRNRGDTVGSAQSMSVEQSTTSLESKKRGDEVGETRSGKMAYVSAIGV